MKRNMVQSLMILIILATCVQTVSAIPPIPESYWGYAIINGIPAANGTSITIEVYDTGEVIGSTTVQYENGGYTINAEFDDAITSEDEGANEGDALIWKLGGVICTAPATDVATSGKANSDFDLVSGDDKISGSLSSASSGDDVGISDEIDDKNPAVPGFSFFGEIFSVFIAIQILRINK